MKVAFMWLQIQNKCRAYVAMGVLQPYRASIGFDRPQILMTTGD